MNSRLSLIDLNINLVLLEYGEQDNIEEIFELLTEEFPEDNITFEEVTEWASMLWEMESLEKHFDYCEYE